MKSYVPNFSTTIMASHFFKRRKNGSSSCLRKREQEICFLITKELIKFHFSDEENNTHFHLFNKLLATVKYWYNNKVLLIGESDLKYKKLLYFKDSKEISDHIRRGINTHLNTVEHIRPVFNYYNKFSSTKYVSGNTSKDVFKTKKSHINYVVMDSGWEGSAAKTLESIPQVISYVKNQFMGFAIPYTKDGKERKYFPDFFRCNSKNW